MKTNSRLNRGIFSNWNKKLYIASKQDVIVDDYNNEIVEYAEPFYMGMCNYMPVTGVSLYAYMSAYGVTEKKLIKCVLDIKHKGKIKPYDLAYLYGATPKDEEVNGANANYYVKSCVEQNTIISVVFEEIVKEVN